MDHTDGLVYLLMEYVSCCYMRVCACVPLRERCAGQEMEDNGDV